jgi:hypothetical protein
MGVQMAYQHSEIIDVAPAHFSSLWLCIGTFIALCGSLFSPQNAFIIRSLLDHRHTASTKISAKESGGITEAILLCTLIIFTLVSLNVALQTCF